MFWQERICPYLFWLKEIKRIWQDNEFRWHVICHSLHDHTLIFTSSLDRLRLTPTNFGAFESSSALFQVVAIITTTGLNCDFAGWTPFLTMLFFGLFFEVKSVHRGVLGHSSFGYD